ncbi:response regulator [Desertifilum sp. FACHB-1129]|uniref:Circadian input-output histidine kinase CikA n=1 Tax=Desertifilum tharense IPPAS B-1220 TaxID=1781255 RepID=A0A1E5QE29_9CYAN|nr:MULTISPECIES: ATP-binding protein [Desertifilum]MDA0213624.1 ATP-binding protein [Cyanobacteria bacterium FC1]MBD2315173.1 response regulator [Desertifilum sp. FACHB-1129]MBD2325199.1 response regulator [Desertifilum sp. FACHB-866]MBD2335317.1 response regulator [Desertifilum sp. FACHB-868]OEJ72930.1 histidine kinase [Desertifilum tharense IPPAS B-1220]
MSRNDNGFNSRQFEWQQTQAEQTAILDRVDNAIALFDRSWRLVLFNQQLANLWRMQPEALQRQPRLSDILKQLSAQQQWSEAQCHQLQTALTQIDGQNISLEIAQTNGIYLEAYATKTSNTRYLLTLRDITNYKQALQEADQIQHNLNAEVQRLSFLLGLTERLQASQSLQDIGQFALSYLINAMNAAFGDVKVIYGQGTSRYASLLTNRISAQFIAVYGEPIALSMQEILNNGIPYGQGLLWQVVESGEPLFIEDYANHPNSVTVFRHPGIGQLGLFPIPATNGKIIGILTLESRSLQKLQQAPQQDMLLAACRTLGVAIERAQAQEELQHINKDLELASQLKSEFLASMSHELRTPLNSILGFAELLQRQTTDKLTQRQSNHVQAIETSGKHLLQLINDILDLSKIEAGKTELDLQMVSIPELCTDCIKMIQPRADKKRLAISLELDYRINCVPLDERRIRQVVINLLSNGVKFTREGGQVKLSSRLFYGKQLSQENRPDRSPVNPSTPYLCLEVQDSGIGIPPAKWPMLFQPFQQIDSSLTRRHEGTGLGLVLTKRLAELHGGTVSFESEEGKGSCFRVWLPLTEMRQTLKRSLLPAAPTTQPMDAGLQVENTKQKRVLVVEDQPYNQALISEVLELENYTVELIGDGRSMLETIHSPLVTRRTLPSLILMDIHLPEVDGLELINQLRAHDLWQTVPIVAVTAMAMPGDRDRCLAAGADAYLSKPLDLTQVLHTVESLIGKGEGGR